MPENSGNVTGQEPRTVADFQLAIDYFGFFDNKPGTIIKQLGVVSEEEAVTAAQEELAKDHDRQIWRIEIYSREIPVEWEKVEEIRR